MHFKKKKKHLLKHPLAWGIVGLIILNLLAFVVFINIWMIDGYRGRIVRDMTDLPAKDAAIVLGAGLNDDGTLGPFLADRMVGALELYNKGYVKNVLVTGDDGRNHQNEVEVMVAFLRDRGVPATDILIDRHGYRTYDSCYRAASVFDIDSAIVITQTFHLYRGLYLCESRDIDVIGFATDRREYTAPYVTGPREILARVKAWWQTEITQPLPAELQ